MTPLFLVATLLAATPEDDARARELYENGARLYEEGLYEEAVAAWEEAWRLSERPLLLFNMANAMERLGRWREAMDLLNRYRAYAPAEEREILDRRIRNIERRLAEQSPEPAPVTLPPPTEPPPERRKVAVVPLALGAVSVVGLGAGTAFGLGALDARVEARELCVEGGADRWCTTEAEAALDADRRLSALADAFLGVGVVSGAVGLGVVLVDGPSGPVPAGLRWSGSFR